MAKRRRLTKSQVTAAVATTIALISMLAKALLPFSAMFGSIGGWLPVIVAAAGVITAAFNQSLSPNHTSVPTEVALAHGIVNKQTQYLIGADDENADGSHPDDSPSSRHGL
jgi:hypothetical protein